MNITDIDQIIEAGGTVTKEYDRLHNRLRAFSDIDDDIIGRLTEALMSDEPIGTVADLRALAVAAEAGTQVHSATVQNAVFRTVHKAMEAEYAKTAVANYNSIRDQFNEHADEFTNAHNVIPATTDPATLVTATDKIRKAWAAGQAAALALTAKVPLLVLAATLAGTRIQHPTVPIGLVAQVDGLHRRRVWEAYDDGWTALLELGATIHAPELHDYADYREPRPIESRQKRGELGFITVQIDPEDEDHTAARREAVIL